MRRALFRCVPRRTVIDDALRETIVGLAYALLVAPLIFVLTDKGHATLEWSQKLYMLADRSGGALGASRENPLGATRPIPSHWYFVDLNGGFCVPKPESALCPPRTANTDHAALARLLKNVLEQRPRLVVLDVLVAKSADKDKGPREDPDEGLTQEFSNAKTPVLLSWFPSSGMSDAATLSAENDRLLYSLDGKDAPKNVRYLPAIKALVGPSALYLLPKKNIALADKTREFPTIAYGAALLLASPADLPPFAHVDAFAESAGQNKCGTFDCDEYATSLRIFSFPPRAPHDDRSYMSRHDNPYYARVTPDRNDPYLDQLAPDLMRDAVVVIGNSDPAASDQTWSALGAVSGAEITINDIRQYLVSSPEAERAFFVQLWAWLWSEKLFYALSALAIFLTEVAVEHLWPQSESPGATHSAAAIFGFRQFSRALFKLCVAVLLSFGGYAAAIGVQRLQMIDMVSPFFGNLIQTFVETLYQVKKGLNALADWLFQRVGLIHASERPPQGQ